MLDLNKERGMFFYRASLSVDALTYEKLAFLWQHYKVRNKSKFFCYLITSRYDLVKRKLVEAEAVSKAQAVKLETNNTISSVAPVKQAP